MNNNESNLKRVIAANGDETKKLKVVSTYTAIKFSLDLEHDALLHLQFLRRTSALFTLFDCDTVMCEALRRYEQCWLPLVAHNPQLQCPPLDVHWLWHVHLLSPTDYQLDCQHVTGKSLVPHRLFPGEEAAETVQNSQKTREAWQAQYPGEPFDVLPRYYSMAEKHRECQQQQANSGEMPLPFDYSQQQQQRDEEGRAATATQEKQLSTNNNNCDDDEKKNSKQPEAFVSKCGYNLAEAAQRQKGFYYQVSLPHFSDKDYLRKCFDRYRKFIFLKQKNLGVFLVPCYDIDVMWHTHQLHPELYAHDCLKYLGRVMPHDDSVNDRQAGSRLYESEKTTSELWQKTFREPFASHGCMYRGESPAGAMHHLSYRECANLCSRSGMIRLAELDVDLSKMEKSQQKQVCVKISFVDKRYRNTQIKLGKFCLHKANLPSEKQKTLNSFQPISTANVKNIEVSFREKKSIFSQGKLISKLVFPVQAYLHSFLLEPNELKQHSSPKSEITSFNEATFTMNSSDKFEMGSVSMKIHVSQMALEKCVCRIILGQFSVVSIGDRSNFWGPANVKSVTATQEQWIECLYAEHKIFNYLNEKEMAPVIACRVIQATQRQLSVVQIVDPINQQIFALGHLITTEQLPLRSMIKSPKKIPHLQSSPHHRAMIIKDNLGDWGVLIGQWVGYKRGKAGDAHTKGVRGDPGKLELEFYRLRSSQNDTCRPEKPCETVRLPGESGMSFLLGALYCDLAHGQLAIYPHSDPSACVVHKSSESPAQLLAQNTSFPDSAQYLCLAFCASVLYVLCEPRPDLNYIPKGGPPPYEAVVNDEISGAACASSSPPSYCLPNGARLMGNPTVTHGQYTKEKIVGKYDVKSNNSDTALLCLAVGLNYETYLPSNSYYKRYYSGDSGGGALLIGGGCGGCAVVLRESENYVIDTR